MSTAEIVITVCPVPIGASTVQHSKKKAISSPTSNRSILQQKKTAEKCRNCRIDPEDLIDLLYSIKLENMSHAYVFPEKIQSCSMNGVNLL